MNIVKLTKHFKILSLLFFATTNSNNLFSMENANKNAPPATASQISGRNQSKPMPDRLEIKRPFNPRATIIGHTVPALSEQSATVTEYHAEPEYEISMEASCSCENFEIPQSDLLKITDQKLEMLTIMERAKRRKNYELSRYSQPDATEIDIRLEARTNKIQSITNIFDDPKNQFFPVLNKKILRYFISKIKPDPFHIMNPATGSLFNDFSDTPEMNGLAIFISPQKANLLGPLILKVQEDPELGSIVIFQALVYIKRLISKGKIKITPSNIYRLFLTSLIMATKLCADGAAYLYYWNDLLEARLDKETFLKLQLTFADAIDFEFYVSPQEIERIIDEELKIVLVNSN